MRSEVDVLTEGGVGWFLGRDAQGVAPLMGITVERNLRLMAVGHELPAGERIVQFKGRVFQRGAWVRRQTRRRTSQIRPSDTAEKQAIGLRQVLTSEPGQIGTETPSMIAVFPSVSTSPCHRHQQCARARGKVLAFRSQKEIRRDAVDPERKQKNGHGGDENDHQGHDAYVGRVVGSLAKLGKEDLTANA